MRRILLAALACLITPFCVSQAAAQETDIASLFPARTRVYVEVKQIAPTFEAARKLIKGSVLENVPDNLEKFRADGDDWFFRGDTLSFFGLWFAPESMKELARLKDAAFGVLDMPKRKANEPGQRDPFPPEPDWLAVVLTGDSNFLHIYARTIVTVDGFFRKVGEVEGVRIYRERHIDYRSTKPAFDDKEDGKKEPERKMVERGPALAILPGALVMGTNVKEVGDVIRRLKGKAAPDALAGQADFKKQAPLRQNPGIFIFGAGDTIAAFADNVFRPRRYYDKVPLDKEFRFEDKKDFGDEPNQISARAQGKDRHEEPWEELLASLKSFKAIGALLTIDGGALELRGNAILDGDDKSVWPGFFTKRVVSTDFLQHVPKEATFAASLAVPEGARFWDKLGKAAPALETEVSEFMTDLNVEKLVQVSVFEGIAQPERRFRGTPFHFLIEAKDAETARGFEKLSKKIAGIGIDIEGRFVVISANSEPAKHLLKGGAKNGLAGEARVVQALKGHENAQVLAVWSWPQSLAKAARRDVEWYREDLKGGPKKGFDKDGFDDKKFDDGKVAFLQPGRPVGPDEHLKDLERMAGVWSKTVENMPPLVFSLSRTEEGVRILMRQPGLDESLPRLLNLIAENEMLRRRGFRPGMHFGLEKTEW